MTKYLLPLLMLLPSSASAARAVMEGINATKVTILIDTNNARVDLATGAYGGGIASVSLYTTSNVVVGASNAIVIYATGSIMLNGQAVSTTTSSGGTNPSWITAASSRPTGGLSSVTFSSLKTSVTYELSGNLAMQTSNGNLLIRMNGDTGTRYRWGCTTQATGAPAGTGNTSDTSCHLQYDTTLAGDDITFRMLISSNHKGTHSAYGIGGSTYNRNDSTRVGDYCFCQYIGNATPVDFNSITVFPSAGTYVGNIDLLEMQKL